MSETERTGAQTLERGLDLIWHLLRSDTGKASVAELVNAIGVPKSTAYRLLKVLKERGFVEEAAGDGQYRLGYRALQFAAGGNYETVLRQLLLPHLQSLASVTGETAILTIKRGAQALGVAYAQSPQPVRFSFQPGVLMPLHAGASAKVLLAFASEKERHQILYRQQGPLDGPAFDPSILDDELAHIRRVGYVTTESEVDTDTTTIAVPLLDIKGRLVAGLSVGGPSFRVTGAARVRILSALREEANLIYRTALLSDC
ncbi:DNA-binding IclR family transcriptional regulator [Rhodopseudomonas rhenobacensis]|uniref:DNA-binding IclR family transcriptional regulator n=1 Tax=Rhodopseudomonas rhenobacensis TaxID=87461 RepID=A0A7W8E1F5_9BRAD|nr:IclR family transcriptional regulator [Rhodopseudomonas rhenobacensis]MBB5049967.1 DNA-binding IclR family transcriptional regulator [Rhodopseudomonas rhenobacensis]